MKERIHILATVRRPELLPATLLVFRTLRVGFPQHPVTVWGNYLLHPQEQWVREAAATAGCGFVNRGGVSHDGWMEQLVRYEADPFWVCDTDMVFLQEVPQPAPGTVISGRFEPEFRDEVSGATHVERLHTCLMYVDPARLRAQMRVWNRVVPDPFRTAEANLIRQQFVPMRNGETRFYDTMSGVWQAGIGTPFTEQQDRAFEHLHCGTYVDIAGSKEGLKDLAAVHRAIYDDPNRARGMWQGQERYYASRATGVAAKAGERKSEQLAVSSEGGGEKTKPKVMLGNSEGPEDNGGTAWAWSDRWMK